MRVGDIVVSLCLVCCVCVCVCVCMYVFVDEDVLGCGGVVVFCDVMCVV